MVVRFVWGIRDYAPNKAHKVLINTMEGNTMQTQTNEPSPIVGVGKPMPRYRQDIICLKLVSIPYEVDAKKAFISGETLFVSAKEKPVSFMDQCESMHISKNRPWKAAVESWRSRNKGIPHFFYILRTIDGKF